MTRRFSSIPYSLLSFLLLTSVWGCDGSSKTSTSKEELAERITTYVAAEIDDYLACSEFSQFNLDTEKLKEMILEPGAVELEDLLTEPQTIAWATQYLGGALEGVILLVRNMLFFMESGHTPTLLTDGWTALNCDGTLELQCVSGSAVSTVLCEDATPTGISFTFNDCVRSGKVYSGSVSIEEVPGDLSAVSLTFDNYKYSADGEIQGSVVFDIDTGTALDISLNAAEELQLISHGGPVEGAPSCASLLAISSLGLALEEERSVLSGSGRRETMDGTFGLTTTDEHLVWATSSTCLCPDPGSGLAFDFPDPLGREGETATANVRFTAPSRPHLCASATVTMTNWPTDCSLIQNASEDCGRTSAERLLGLSLSALCRPLE